MSLNASFFEMFLLFEIARKSSSIVYFEDVVKINLRMTYLM